MKRALLAVGLAALAVHATAAGVEVSFQDPDKFADAAGTDLELLKPGMPR